jgi:hypothetical protein
VYTSPASAHATSEDHALRGSRRSPDTSVSFSFWLRLCCFVVHLFLIILSGLVGYVWLSRHVCACLFLCMHVIYYFSMSAELPALDNLTKPKSNIIDVSSSKNKSSFIVVLRRNIVSPRYLITEKPENRMTALNVYQTIFISFISYVLKQLHDQRMKYLGTQP